MERAERLLTQTDPETGRALPQEHDIYDLVEESKFIQYPSDQGLLAPVQETETLQPQPKDPDCSVQPVKVSDGISRHKTSITGLELGFVPEEEETGALNDQDTTGEEVVVAKETVADEDLGVATRIKVEKKRLEAPPPAGPPRNKFKDFARKISLQLRQARPAIKAVLEMPLYYLQFHNFRALFT